MSRLRTLYQEKIMPALSEEFGLKNKMALPRIEKVVLNVGTGQNKVNPKFSEQAMTTLEEITGQKPTKRYARKAISGFKVRAGDEVGVSVTLRGEKMYDFLDKLANVTLPRLRDFRGLSYRSFDSRGNFTLGIKEQIIFPEITHEKVQVTHGLEITVTVKNSSPEKSRSLLEKIGFPFESSGNK